MAKKKFKITGRLLGVIIAIVIGAGVVGIMYGLPLVQALPPFDEDTLEIPFVDEMIIEENEEIIEEIEDVIENQDMFCTFSSETLTQVAECRMLTEDEQFNENPMLPSGIDCNGWNQILIDQCTEQIDVILDELYADLMEVTPPTNQTEFSEQDPLEQLCEESPDLLFCTNTPIQIVTQITKTDSAGVVTNVETSFDIPLASIFVEDTSDIDFRSGILEFNLGIKGDPMTTYNGNGLVDLTVNEVSIFSEPVPIRIMGTTDEEGNLPIDIQTPLGGFSDLILFKFSDHLDKFPDIATSPLKLIVNEIAITSQFEQGFELFNQELFIMDIFKDNIKLLIIDEEGNAERLFPTDSRILITGKASSTNLLANGEQAFTGTTKRTVFDSAWRCNGCGCSQHTVISDTTSEPNTPVPKQGIPAPTISGISLSDLDSNVLDSVSSTTAYDFAQIPRFDNYTLKTTVPNAEFELEYGRAQETKSYQCTQEGSVNLIGTRYQSGEFKPCSTVVITSGLILDPANPVTVKPNTVSCNFP